ncbi:RHS repeat-associated core domain-containing protein [Pseudomaricurvus alcaniphilus]|uniref:RHS repeat-associated core domain-containing protein n=1 Tax=Pseudomaricurvus alcaniphilus TaxID=1166482 RepID=UPI00140D91D9|nr:RHS repeat-associated core domain-containing protein [Pseudomaricurvus alcaniphilus]NHN38974.1 RHS repeat-associated core domain-containing protein [Pseudomaricurvus alcaniphilus]
MICVVIACDEPGLAGCTFIEHVKQSGGSEAKTYFDLLGREIRRGSKTFDGSWSYVDTEYDNIGRVKRKSEPHSGTAQYWTEFDYDILGRLVATKLPGVTAPVTVTYNAFTTITTNPAGQQKTEVKNELGELIEVEDNLGSKINYFYDVLGNLERVTNSGTDFSTTEIRMCYDSLGRKVGMRDPSKGGFLAGTNNTCPAPGSFAAKTGWWVYQYNAFGELIGQIDAKGQRSIMDYDQLGRMITREDKTAAGVTESLSTWTYNNATSGRALGALQSVSDSVSGYIKVIGHDQFGRVTETVTSLAANDNHYEYVMYDDYGRVSRVYDAAGDGSWESEGITNVYNIHGYLHKVVEAGPGSATYYQVNAMDLRGNVTEWVSGNGLTSNRYYDPATGRLKTLDTSMLASFGVVQDHEYDWDNIGNLTERTRTTGSNTLQETFVYDGLNRLRHVKVGGAIQQNIQYYKNGNIKSKTGVGTYTYGNNAGPHAVTKTSTGNISYTYDANGNMTSDTSGRSLQYTTFDKPKLISKGGHTTEFKYGPNRARYLRTDTDTNGTTVTRYIGSVEKVTKADGSQVIKRYIGDALVTISKSSSGTETARTTQYLYKDHLGSLDVIVEGGNTQEYRFDAWGQRINPSTSAVLANIATDINFSVATIATTRGFTGHEMLDQVGLIHMNGRIYDARLGRFLQADPFIQFPDNTQSYNRYSYVMNNPLVYTDPSGYFSFKDVVKVVAVVVISVVTYGAASAWAAGAMAGTSIGCSMAASSFIAGAVGGAAAGFAAGVSSAAFSGASPSEALRSGFNGALYGGISGGLFGAIGSSYMGLGGKALAHGMTGGIMSDLQGGKFGHGFLSAGLTKLANVNRIMPNDAGSYADTVRVMSAAVLGGTISAATGGKFANGATTAAFATMFNEAAGAARRSQRQALQARRAQFNKFMGFVRAQGVERGASDDFIFEQIASDLSDLPDVILDDWEPGGIYAPLVDDLGDHVFNQRLPGGYHLTVDHDIPGVQLHYDAHDPMAGPLENIMHGFEVWDVKQGNINKVYRNDYPDWGQ